MIRVNVTVALQLQDDFSGAELLDVRPQFWFNRIPVAPLKKTEGYFVFTQAITEATVITVALAGYETLAIPVAQLPLTQGRVQGVLMLRLLRAGVGGKQMANADCDVLIGTCTPEQRVIAYAQDEKPLRLQSFGAKEGVGWVLLQGHQTASATNRRFCVQNGEQMEYFLVVGRNRDGTFRLQEPLSEALLSGAQVRRVYTAISDATGTYQLFVDKGLTLERLQQTYVEKEGIDWEYKCVQVPR